MVGRHRLVAPVDGHEGLGLAGEQQQRTGRGALLEQPVVVLRVADVDDLGPRVELLVGQLLEQVHAPQFGLNGHSARYSWISETAIEPSPTALATRLIERARTSPATNTPGTVVSST